MKLIRKKRKDEGFTLVELMVVISIILILSGFMVPKVVGYQDKAKNAKAVNTARQIFAASIESYTEEEGNLDKTKLFNSISTVTDIVSDAEKIKVEDNTATVTFNSDKKIYNVIISPIINKFEVKEHSNNVSIYSNK